MESDLELPPIWEASLPAASAYQSNQFHDKQTAAWRQCENCTEWSPCLQVQQLVEAPVKMKRHRRTKQCSKTRYCRTKQLIEKKQIKAEQWLLAGLWPPTWQLQGVEGIYSFIIKLFAISDPNFPNFTHKLASLGQLHHSSLSLPAVSKSEAATVGVRVGQNFWTCLNNIPTGQEEFPEPSLSRRSQPHRMKPNGSSVMGTHRWQSSSEWNTCCGWKGLEVATAMETSPPPAALTNGISRLQ